MTASSSQIRYYFDNFGFQTKGTWQPPDSAMADYCENFISQLQEGIESRNGYQTKLINTGGYGIIDYSYIDIDNELVQEKLIVDTNLYRLLTGTLNITYVGSEPRAVARVLPDPDTNNWIFTLTEANVVVYTNNLGTGLESSPVTLATLSAAITALANYTCTVTGDDTQPAAFLNLEEGVSIPPNYTKSISYLYKEQIDKLIDEPLDGLAASIANSNPVNVSWTNHKGLIILTDGTKPKVYDGSTIYLAGLPVPAAPPHALLSDSSPTTPPLSGEYSYYITYEYIDFQGKLTESAFSSAITETMTGFKMQLNIPTLRDTSGYNTKYASVNGTQTPTISNTNTASITVQSGHNLKRGDWAYFFNSHADVNEYKAYTIDSVTSTTLTIRTGGDNITVVDNIVISNNLKINIYRSSGSSDNRLFVVALPNDPRVGSIIYEDHNGDETNMPVFSGTLTQRRDPPPPASYCTSYRGSLVLAKDLFIFWSDDLEPAIANSGLVFDYSSFLGSFNRPITALQNSDTSLIIFQDTAITSYISTNLNSSDIIENQVSSKIGCTGQPATVRLGDRLWFLSKSGVYEINSGQITLNQQSTQENQLSAKSGLGGSLSLPIQHIFNNYKDYAWDRAIMGVDVLRNYLFIYLPVESIAGLSERSSDTLVYELDRSRWYLWKDMDIAGGILCDTNNELYFISRLYGANATTRLNHYSRRRDDYGYLDHLTAIKKVYETKWDGVAALPFALDQKNIEQVKFYNITSRFDKKVHTDFSLKIYKDYENIAHTDIVYSFSIQGNEWGLLWNDQPYGSFVSATKKNMLERENVEAIKIVITHTDTSNCPITGWEIKYVTRPPQMKA